jgi:hypothetical protein
MNDRSVRQAIRLAGISALLLCAALPLLAGMKNWAVVAAAGSKLQDVSLADLSKYCKGTTKSWPDGRAFTLVVRNPDSPEMRGAMEKLLGPANPDAKPASAKASDARVNIKVVDSDEDLIRMVASTPGAIGLLDVYSINSSLKVLRVDGKLPFDAGYSLKVN